MRLIPRSIVRIKNELLLDARYLLFDPRLRTLAASPDAGGYVTYVTYAGLANRLRAHYLAACIANRLGRRLVPLWMSTKELASDGADVFAASFEANHTLAYARYDRLRIDDHVQRDLAQISAGGKRRLLVVDYDAQWVPLAKATALFARDTPVELPIRAEVVDAANTLVRTFERPILAVHIRQADFLTHTPFARPMSYFEGQIERALERRDDYRTLLVASDDAVQLNARVTSRFRHVGVLTPAFSRSELGVAPEALVHAFAIAAGSDFIDSPQSSFSELIEALRRELVVVPGLQREGP
jgi:hypothetical protein